MYSGTGQNWIYNNQGWGSLHIAITIWSLLAAWKWADWKRWYDFLPTLYYITSMNLLYQYIAHSTYHLWHNEHNLINELCTDNLYSFIVFPCTVMLFLSNYPNKNKEIIVHIVKWILIYSTLEWIVKEYGFMAYYHGWSWKWSLLFNLIMFPMLRLHHVKPLMALGISPLIILTLLLLFY